MLDLVGQGGEESVEQGKVFAVPGGSRRRCSGVGGPVVVLLVAGRVGVQPLAGGAARQLVVAPDQCAFGQDIEDGALVRIRCVQGEELEESARKRRIGERARRGAHERDARFGEPLDEERVVGLGYRVEDADAVAGCPGVELFHDQTGDGAGFVVGVGGGDDRGGVVDGAGRGDVLHACCVETVAEHQCVRLEFGAEHEPDHRSQPLLHSRFLKLLGGNREGFVLGVPNGVQGVRCCAVEAEDFLRQLGEGLGLLRCFWVVCCRVWLNGIEDDGGPCDGAGGGRLVCDRGEDAGLFGECFADRAESDGWRQR
ncbi:hypothetical protein [Arthrobacter roseus]|uniref:hypothetical protein n=1 Tax=Arthrobacter roseus TaxID=136274 RepID=UPI0019632475|nr:hypothetical protein [Arthrobacter roseus]